MPRLLTSYARFCRFIVRMPDWPLGAIVVALLVALSLCGCTSPDIRIGETIAPLQATQCAVSLALDVPCAGHLDDCNAYALSAFDHLRGADMHPRYVLAVDELGEGHLFVIYDGRDGKTWARDNRIMRDVPLDYLIRHGYRLIGVSDEKALYWFRTS